jgi:hypothetical protein
VLGAQFIKLCDTYMCKACWHAGQSEPILHYGGNLAILSTCRQIYTETKLLPFALDTIIIGFADLPKLRFWQSHASTDFQIEYMSDDVETTIKDNKWQIVGLDYSPYSPSISPQALVEMGRLKSLKRVCLV